MSIVFIVILILVILTIVVFGLYLYKDITNMKTTTQKIVPKGL